MKMLLCPYLVDNFVDRQVVEVVDSMFPVASGASSYGSKHMRLRSTKDYSPKILPLQMREFLGAQPIEAQLLVNDCRHMNESGCT
jgi:hypothetical protein